MRVRDKVREAYAASSWPSEVLVKAGYQRWNAPIRSSLSTRVRTWSRRWASCPSSLHLAPPPALCPALQLRRAEEDLADAQRDTEQGPGQTFDPNPGGGGRLIEPHTPATQRSRVNQSLAEWNMPL